MISMTRTRNRMYNLPMALTTEEAAVQLGIQSRMVRVLIKQGKLPAKKHGRDWIIEEKDLERVRDRPGVGRPRTSPATDKD